MQLVPLLLTAERPTLRFTAARCCDKHSDLPQRKSVEAEVTTGNFEVDRIHPSTKPPSPPSDHCICRCLAIVRVWTGRDILSQQATH
jgi:hypothetical protein